jgi:hypothetical protein
MRLLNADPVFERLMEQQLGGRAPQDPRRTSGAPTNGENSTPYRYQDGRTSSGSELANDQGDAEGLQKAMASQKIEIVRLLNTVKTLSSENTKLVKVRCSWACVLCVDCQIDPLDLLRWT